MSAKQSPMALVMKHRMLLDVGHAKVEATVYDEQLSETFKFFESFNYESEKPAAVRRAVERAAKKAEQIASRNAA